MQNNIHHNIFWKNLNLKKKIMLLYVPVIVLGIFSIFYILSSIVKIKTLEQFCKTNLNLIENISDKAEYINENIINISNSYLSNTDLPRFFRRNGTEETLPDIRRQDRLESKIVDTTHIFLNIDFNTTMISLDGQAYISDSDSFTIEENRKRAKMYQEYLNQNIFQLVWMTPFDKNGEHIISAVRYVFDTNTAEPAGMLIFDFNEEVFKKLYKKYLNDGEVIYLLKEDGQVLSASENKMIGQSVSKQQWFQQLDGYRKGYFYSSDEKQLIVFVKNQMTGMYMVEKIPRSLLILPYRDILRFMPFILFVVLMGAIFISEGISRYIAKPIQQLTKQIQSNYIDSDETHEPMADGDGRDEIAFLNDQYQKMMDRLNKMIAEIYREQEQKRIYEMEALQSQINPHFLCNTLLSVRYLNITDQREEIDKVLSMLIQILFSYFKDKDKTHTIKQEIEFLENYTYIQKVRYGNNFNAEISCAQEALEYRIPKLILQPFVENAIFHGVSSYEKGGIIKVEVSVKDDEICITICDNGIGVQEKEEEQNKVVHHGIGIKNVKERLRLIYGNDYKLSIDSIKNAGTEVRLVIPAGEKENESNDCG